MNKTIAVLRRKTALAAIFLLAAGQMAAVPAHASDWLDSIQDQRCDPQDIHGVSGNVRNAIESSVRRAEMSIKAPTPVGDLSCLNDLMTAPLDMFSNIGGLLGSLQGGLANLSAPSLNLDIDISGMVCGFAAQKFAQLTAPLSEIGGTMAGFASMSSNPADRLAGILSGAYTDLSTRPSGGGTISASDGNTLLLRDSSVGSFSGVLSATDSSGYAGSVEDYTAPSTISVLPDISEETYDYTYVGPDDSAYNAAADDYNTLLMRAFADYTACRIAGEFDGTYAGGYGGGTWNVPGTISDCTFNPGAAPIFYVSSDSAATPEPGVSATTQSADPAITVDRAGGQERTVDPEAAAAAQQDMNEPVDPARTIWDQLVK